MMNASDIRSRLRSYYPSLEWALLFEVGNATGGRKTRSADAIAMNLWPSRGLSIHGIEIKVSRSDFKAEMKNPLKAEEIAQYCDYWWIAAPADMLQPDELPEAWGLLVSSNDSMKIRKQAIKNEIVKQPDRAFVAGLARQIGNADKADVDARVEALIEPRLKTMRESQALEIEARLKEFRKLQQVICDFEKASGLLINSYSDGKALGERVKLVEQFDRKGWGVLAGLPRQLQDAATRIENALSELHEATP